MNNKEPKTLSSDVRFENTVCETAWNVRTQEIDKALDCWETVEACILDVFDDAGQFVTLTAGNIQDHVRFVQAAQAAEGIVVQAGIEEADYTRLVEKMCTEEECLDIFREFYASTRVPDLEKYTPVQFYNV